MAFLLPSQPGPEEWIGLPPNTAEGFVALEPELSVGAGGKACPKQRKPGLKLPAPAPAPGNPVGGGQHLEERKPQVYPW